MRNSWSVLSLVALMVGAGGGCTPDDGVGRAASSAGAGGEWKTPARIVCTTGQVGDIVRHIGGDLVTVDVLMGPGVDPHLYKAIPSDKRKLNAAQAVFYNGLHLEGRMADFLEGLAERKPCQAAAEVLEQKYAAALRRPPEFQGFYDPHVWFDVSLWAHCAESIEARLVELDPAHATAYRENGKRYRDELARLHEYCRDQIATIPKTHRVMVTAHDAFGYFGKAYDIEVHGIQGISTADEASLDSLNQLVDLLVERKIKAVFVETSVPAKYVQALVEGCAARKHRVEIGGKLFSDAMGDASTPEGTYAGMVKANVHTIVQALK